MASTVALGRDLKSLSSQLASIESQLDTSKSLLNSYANSANNSTSQSTYNTYVSKYDAERNNFDNLVSDYKEIGGNYSTTLDKYNTLTFSNQSQVITYDIPNAKDNYEWLAGGEFYNEKNAGGYVWSATNPLSPDEKPKQDLALVINRGSIHPYLNEGFTEIQNTIRGFGFLDLLGDYTDSTATVYETTVTITSSDGSEHIFTNYTEGEGGLSDFGSIQSMTQSNMGVEAIAQMLNTPGMNLMSLNALGLAEFTVTNLLNGNFFKSGKMEIGNIVGATLYNSAKNIFSQQLTMGLVNSLGIKSVYAAGLLSVGVGALLGEFFEMAVGYDNSFGYGGEFSAKGSQVLGQKAYRDNTILGDLSFGLGIADELSVNLTDWDGNKIGVEEHRYGGINDTEYTGYGPTSNQALNDVYNQITRDFNDYIGAVHQETLTDLANMGDLNSQDIADYASMDLGFAGYEQFNNGNAGTGTGFNGASSLSDGGWGNIGNTGDDDGYGGNNF